MSVCTWHSLSKCVQKREQHLRGNDQRRYLRSLSRQASFIAEYIQHKYPEQYNEAAAYFNTLNSKYPTKPELRKTKEFRQFKAHMSGEQVKQRVKPIPQYQYINIVECSSSNTGSEVESLSSQSPFEWRCPASTEPESPQRSPIEPESPQRSPIEPESPQRSPIEPESPQRSPIEPESPQRSPIEPESPQRSPNEPPYNDNMVLRIPLLEPPQKSPPAIITETVEIVTEEITNPITLDDISPEKVDELINQLRHDPDLQNIFRDIEEQMEFEELGMGIDLPEHDLLEDELFEW